jgi:hypothetical protein
MRRKAAWLAGMLTLAVCQLAVAQLYLYRTNEETSLYGDAVTAFRHGDTLWGDIRSNTNILIEGDPVFYGNVITPGADFVHGPDYAPQFLGPAPSFNAPRLLFETANVLDAYRNAAQATGHHYDDPGMTVRANFHGTSITMYQWPTGTPVDSSQTWTVNTSPNVHIFTDGPLEIRGHLTGQVTIASAQDVYIIGDIKYDDANTRTGVIPPAQLETSSNILGIVAGGDVRIANTVENGRNNSDGLGLAQNRLSFTSVTITAAIYAQGSLTFDQQNTPASDSVCACIPDDRGTVYIFGSVQEGRRGALHNNNNQSTGYLQRMVWDSRYPYFSPLTGRPGHELPLALDTLDFGDVIIGTSVRDTAVVDFPTGQFLATVSAWWDGPGHPQPFIAAEHASAFSRNFRIPVNFTPPDTGRFTSGLSLFMDEYRWIYLTGRGVTTLSADDPFILHPTSLIVSASPNPFNASTLLHFNLAVAGRVSLIVYDLLGKQVQTLVNEYLPTGERTVRFDGASLGSGLYFAHLQTPQGSITTKLLLVK